MAVCSTSLHTFCELANIKAYDQYPYTNKAVAVVRFISAVKAAVAVEAVYYFVYQTCAHVHVCNILCGNSNSLGLCRTGCCDISHSDSWVK